MPKKIEISHRTIIFTALFLLLLWFLYLIRDILLIFFISLLLMAIINPAVTKLSKYRIPRVVSVLFVYMATIVILTLIIGGILPALIEQTTNFANNLPSFLSGIGLSSYFSDQIIEELIVQLGKLPAQIIKVIFSIFSNVIAVITVTILTLYLLLSRNKIDEQLTNFLGEKQQKRVEKIVDNLEEKLGGWARGELALMVLVGLFTFIGLSLLGIPYALPLSLLAGVLEIIPNLGPIIAAVPSVIIGFGISPAIGIAVIVLAFIIQQVENYVFVPKVMEKSVGVSPIITLLALAVGFKVSGIIGALISVPVLITFQVLIKEYLSLKQ